MKSDESSPPGRSDESAKRIREALRAEIRSQGRSLRQVGGEISRSDGYLAKFLGGKFSLSIENLQQALDVLGVEPRRFFARAFGTDRSPEGLLEGLEALGSVHQRLGRIEKTARKLEITPPRTKPPSKRDAAALLEQVVLCTGVEQRRRLGTAEKYRDPAFARAYLEHLDALRYDDPKAAALNAEAVAVRLVPMLRGPQAERLALEAKAIGVYGSALRQRGDFATAARAARFALTLAQRHGLQETKADMLQRGAYVLSDHGRFNEALDLLDEALVIYFDLNSNLGLGMVQVDRGSMLNYLGEYRASSKALWRALALLTENSGHVSHNRLATYQILASNYLELGELDHAEHALKDARKELSEAGSLSWAKILWQDGRISLARAEYSVAEDRFRSAQEFFFRAEGPDRALVSLDLAKALIQQGKTGEATSLAVIASEYLKSLRGNRMATATLSGLARAAVEGNLTLDRIEKAQAQFEDRKRRLLRR